MDQEEKQGTAEAPTGRRLGKHVFPAKIDLSGLSPTEVSASGKESGAVPEEGLLKIDHHHSIDKSMAGGGVILGGLATTFLVAIFCYIRATRRKSVESGSPTSLDSSSIGRKVVEPAN